MPLRSKPNDKREFRSRKGLAQLTGQYLEADDAKRAASLTVSKAATTRLKPVPARLLHVHKLFFFQLLSQLLSY
jgi:hypothetical protein